MPITTALGRRAARAPAGLLLALALLASGAPAQEDMPPAPVVVAEAKQTRLSPVVWFPGTVISRHDAQLAAEEAGLLVEVAEVGSRVEAGEVVARLDDALLRQTLAEHEAVVERDSARLAYLRREVERLERLVEGNNVPESELDEAVSDRAVTAGELAAARARVAAVKERLRRTVVRAPFRGVVSDRLASPGEWAESGEPIARIVDVESVEVQAWVPGHSLAFVAPGERLELRANPHGARGTVRAVVPVGENTSRLYELRIDVAEGSWPPGQMVQVAVPVAEAKDVVAVPRDALVLRRDGVTVYRVLEDDTVEAVSVTTGIGSGELVEVSGIDPGDRVVIRGGERLRPGQKVRIVPLVSAQ